MSRDFRSKRRRAIVKASIYIILLVIILFVVTHLLKKHPVMRGYDQYLPYVHAVLVLGIGYMAVSSIGHVIYYTMRRVTDHSTAAVTRTIVRIAGIALLIAFLGTIFGINPASALTVGSFSGLVVGFATQNVLNHAVAGIFLAISRPFKHGDLVTIAGQTGKVIEITVMYTKLRSTEEKQDILIPSGKIIGEIILTSRKSKLKTRAPVRR